MRLQPLLDEHFPTHSRRVDLSLGWVTVMWLTHILCQAEQLCQVHLPMSCSGEAQAKFHRAMAYWGLAMIAADNPFGWPRLILVCGITMAQSRLLYSPTRSDFQSSPMWRQTDA